MQAVPHIQLSILSAICLLDNEKITARWLKQWKKVENQHLNAAFLLQEVAAEGRLHNLIMSSTMVEDWKSKLSKTSTSTYVVLAVIAVVFLITARRPKSSKGKSGKGSSNKSKKTKSQFEKAPVPLTLEEQIDNVSLRYNNELRGRSSDLINRFNAEDEKDIYQRNYCNEMLLKLLIELDGIDLINVDESLRKSLKNKRKAVIKQIQGMLKSLDSLK